MTSLSDSGLIPQVRMTSLSDSGLIPQVRMTSLSDSGLIPQVRMTSLSDSGLVPQVWMSILQLQGTLVPSADASPTVAGINTTIPPPGFAENLPGYQKKDVANYDPDVQG
jgi:hypothetical protein